MPNRTCTIPDCNKIEEFDREDIFERDEWTCYLCGKRCTKPSPFDMQSATVDHVRSLWSGGEHSRANARTACLLCNSTKRARPVAA